MDTSKINPFVFILFPFLLFSNFSFASIVDLAGSGATWLRDTNSENLMKLTPNSSAVLSGNNLTLVEKVSIPTSKGTFAVDLQRTAAVDVSRVGKSIRGLAVTAGPLGLAITAVDAICSLTSICNQAGEWIFGPSEADQVSGLVGGWVGNYEASPVSCPSDVDGRGCASLIWGSAFNIGGFSYIIHPDRIDAEVRLISKSTGADMGSGKLRKIISNFTPQPQAPATASNWDSKEPLLNDIQFVPELLNKQYPVPVQAPSITTPQKFPIGNQTTTLKDGNGNTTGTQTTTTEAEITTPSAAENPSGSPSVIRITETSITNNYNINNELTSSTTTTTGGTEKPQQQSYEIEIDNVNPDTLQEKPVSFPFDTNSWGSGSCPADRTVNYHYGSLNLTFQPACDFATGIKPIVLILAGFVAMYIISGAVRDA